MNKIVFNVDVIDSTHDEMVFTAFKNLAAENVVYGTLNRPYNQADKPFMPSYEDVSFALVGVADVINWSFSELIYTDNYNYSKDDVIRKGFLENTAFTVSAGNNAGCGGDGQFALFLIRSGVEIPEGMYARPAFERIDITSSSPYDFTVGSIQTFRWNTTGYEPSMTEFRAIKDAVFDIACSSEVAPRFVDFYSYGDLGTSFAAPGVAGLITHILQDNPDYDLNQIRTVLERNSKLMEFERYTDYALPTEKTKLIVQVLDPYDLENNTIRDGRVGSGIDLFTNGITREDYTFTFDTTHIIDTQTKVDGLYEILLGRNPDQGGLDSYVNLIEKNNWNLQDVITTFANSDEARENNWFNLPNAEATSQVALIERVQALYHVGLTREPSLQETVNVIDHYKNKLNENWQQLVSDFVGLYNVDFFQQI